MCGQDRHQSLSIAGQSASLYHDDVTAAWLENQQHLQLWMENKEEDLWIDRYDVRQLLSDASLFAKCVVPVPCKRWSIRITTIIILMNPAARLSPPCSDTGACAGRPWPGASP